MERESMDFDVVIVGGGPSGLAAACRIMQLAKQQDSEISVCLVEKGSEIGAHILSGAVVEPTALNELFPDWQERGAPLNNPVIHDEVYYLVNATNRIKVPSFMVPRVTHNRGNHAVSLGNLCRWLGEQAEALGVDVFPGFAASEIIYGDDGAVTGIVTSDMGIGASGEQKATFAAGYELRAKYTIFAEGCRGNLGKQLMEKFELQTESATQHYAIGFKELWDVPPENHVTGKVVHTVGWPGQHFGGMFTGSYLYHLENNQISLGLIVDLSYSNPHVSPFDEFQRWKHHPLIAETLKGGTRVSYGARAIVKGGLSALPELTVPGGLLVGDNAGFLNMTKVKGSHTAMKSGMLAAEAVFESLAGDSAGGENLTSFTDKFEQSWLHDELDLARNSQQAIHKFGTLLGSAFVLVDQTLFRGKLPFTLKDPTPDHATLKKAADSKRIDYPKPDGVLSFDKLSSVFISNTNHEEDQPCHLQLLDSEIPIARNLPDYDEPAQRYCPAGVYEVVEENGETRFQINAQNCVHCKTCDIKDPAQNIVWVVPEGTGGPNYPNM
ncbi:MAG: electron transfer flavoprotein-ubiquinone oxidoreductase [Gammaproteobacteria bacterium]|nr:electron transfer flavoprotein-ubiquinone oxidoreductase [Gammaproteobacteria bacterium]